MSELMERVGFGSSDYGGSFKDFDTDFVPSVKPKTSGSCSATPEPAAWIRAPTSAHLRAIQAVGLAKPGRQNPASTPNAAGPCDTGSLRGL